MLRDTGGARIRVRRQDYTPPGYLIDRTRLNFLLGEEYTTVEAELTIRRNPQAPSTVDDLILDGEELELLEVAVDGIPLANGTYEVGPDRLVVHDLPAHFVLTTRVRIHPECNTALSGLYRSSGNFCTQCEAEGFRKITYYIDRPDVLSRFTTRIEADQNRYPVLLSNGNLIGSGPTESGRHYAEWQDPFPKPSYLFALVAGDLACRDDNFVTASGRRVKLKLYVEPHNLSRTAHAMEALKRAMRWDEQRYGREYDLDIFMIVAVDDFNMGAMENKGLNIFNSKYILADPKTATDQDYAAIEAVIGHEYFHNWTGDRITLRDWFQLSLKEGLTVYREQQFSAAMTSPAIKRIQDVRFLRQYQFAEDAGPMAHPVRPDEYMEINNFYTVTVYEKGAEVVGMYETLLGSEGFRRGTDRYFERHDGQAVTCDDFRAAMSAANSTDLEQFGLWYEVSGTPLLKVHGTYSPAEHTYTLEMTQEHPDTPGQPAPQKPPLLIPVRMALLDAQGRPLALKLRGGDDDDAPRERVLWLHDFNADFVFTDVPSPPVPSLLRGLSAPVRLDFPYDDHTLAFLAGHDNDPFNRWDSTQTLIVRVIKRLVNGAPIEPAAAPLVESFRQLLTTSGLDPALIAETLSLPSEPALAREFDPVAVEALHTAWNDLRRRLAAALETEFVATRDRTLGTEPYRFTAEQVGRRHLHAVVLDYLAALNRPEYIDQVESLFNQADNMSDQLAALGTLSTNAVPARRRALNAFRKRHDSDPLVLDKWLTLQAVSPLPGALNRVKTLMTDPVFSIKSPNRVRSLLGAFAHHNHAGFHAADGSAYRFIAAQILTLDGINPQVAARLVSCFAHWRCYDSNRQAGMRAELERLAASEGLSRDVYEIVERSLT